MKKNIVRAIVVCTMAMSLIVAGVTAINTANAGVAVCHDGPTNGIPVR